MNVHKTFRRGPGRPLNVLCRFNLQRFQPSRIFRECPEIKHHVPKSQNTIYLSSSTFEENPKFLFFHSPDLLIYKLTSSSAASSTIFKYYKSQRWCLLKSCSSSVLLYLGNLIPRPYIFQNRACTKILIIHKNRFYYMTKKEKKCWFKRLLMWREICVLCGEIFSRLV